MALAGFGTDLLESSFGLHERGRRKRDFLELTGTAPPQLSHRVPYDLFQDANEARKGWRASEPSQLRLAA